MLTLSRHNGFTLVELMITLLLSLTITYGISQVLISSNKTALSADGISQSQETGRFVISFLAKRIREAGRDSIKDFSSNKPQQDISALPFISCSKFPELNADECIFEGTNGNGDRLAVSFVATTGNLKDCTGSSGYKIGAAPIATPYKKDDIILNTFWVERDGTSEMNSLHCQGHLFDGEKITGSSSKQAIANGVEAIHFLYGEAADSLSGAKNRNVTKYIAANDVTNWEQVYAVRVSIMTRSITEATNDNAPRKYVLLDSETYEMTDTINRQVFTTTFAINNY